MNYRIMFFILIVVSLSTGQKSDLNNKKINSQSGKAVHSLSPSVCACSLSVRIDRFHKWLKTFDKPDSVILNDIKTRKETMVDTAHFPIDTSGMIFEGVHSAPVWVVAYVSMTCPLCKRLYRELYDTIQNGSLKGMVRIGIKPFTTTPMDAALVAAGRWHKQSAILNALEPVKTRITMEIVTHIADSLGIAHDDFAKATQDPAVISYVKLSRDEGVKNGVSVTPTFFINGHRYKSYKDSQWVIDAIEHRYYCGSDH